MSARFGLVGKNPPGPIWAHLGPFFASAGKIKKMHKFCLFSLVGQWALFTRFGALAAIHPRWGNRYQSSSLQMRWRMQAGACGRAARPNRISLIFPGHATNGPRWPQVGPGGFFFTNPDPAGILLGQLQKIFYFFVDFWSFHGPFWGQEA